MKGKPPDGKATGCLFNLYVHLPFCFKKCPYCDFVAGPFARRYRSPYLSALIREMQAAPLAGHDLQTVYFGGGTPTELSRAELNRIVEAVGSTFSFTDGCELSVECNPGTIDRGKLRSLRQSGVNRVSLGVQSFDDGALRFLGRIHDTAQALDGFEMARACGFENINLDLICGYRGQTREAWIRDLDTALSLGPEHLSVYYLTVEDRTEFGRRAARGEDLTADEDTGAALLEMAMDQIEKAGLAQYEISNFARPGRECIHSLGYWDGTSCLGIGVGAASYHDGRRWTNTRNLNRYISSTLAGRTLLQWDERLPPQEALAESIMLGLRTRSGVSLRALSRRFGIDTGRHFAGQIGHLVETGLLHLEGDLLTPTRKGMLLASTVALEFLGTQGVQNRPAPTDEV